MILWVTNRWKKAIFIEWKTTKQKSQYNRLWWHKHTIHAVVIYIHKRHAPHVVQWFLYTRIFVLLVLLSHIQYLMIAIAPDRSTDIIQYIIIIIIAAVHLSLFVSSSLSYSYGPISRLSVPVSYLPCTFSSLSFSLLLQLFLSFYAIPYQQQWRTNYERRREKRGLRIDREREKKNTEVNQLTLNKCPYSKRHNTNVQ